VQGNLKKEAKSIRESIEHMRSMRDTWKEAFEIYQKEEQEQESAPNTMTRETVDVSSTSSFNSAFNFYHCHKEQYAPIM
jgi:hypothetical protein